MSSDIKAPPELDPRFPPPDSERVALLQGLEWPDNPSVRRGDFDAYAAQFTINGRPLTDQEKTLFGACGYNDMAASLQLSYQAVQITNERVELTDQMDALLNKYGWDKSESHTLGQIRDAMTPADGAEFDRLADILWPDGYLYLEGDK